MATKKERGDFQTPPWLAREVVGLLADKFDEPGRLVEPTCGLGSFLQAAAERWGGRCRYEGYEINPDYVSRCRASVPGANIRQDNFFDADWGSRLRPVGGERVWVVGNPPWVTAAALSRMGGDNRPERRNFPGLRGIEAKTGSANFDIAEWMLIRLIEEMPEDGVLALLCKTGTARRVLRHFWRRGRNPQGANLHSFDAKSAFGIAASACLFVCRGGVQEKPRAGVCAGLDGAEPLGHIGLAGADIVADIDAYERLSALDGGSGHWRWRSGIKHDAARVMEFAVNAGTLSNGFGESVDIESDRVYPLIKASEIGHGCAVPEKAVLVPQMTTGEDTRALRESAPKTWAYLCGHAAALDARKSSIYRNRPRFAIFGVGPYSFAPWKVAISGFDRQVEPVVMGPHEGKPVMVDDTSYSLGFDDEESARRVADLMRSGPAKAFLRSLVFDDAKRPVTAALLNRIDLDALEAMASRGMGRS